jgi:hypothetical protein
MFGASLTVVAGDDPHAEAEGELIHDQAHPAG